MNIPTREHVDVGSSCPPVDQLIRVIRSDCMLNHMSTMPMNKLAAWCRNAQRGLQMSTTECDADVVNHIWYELGSSGALSGVPLPELVRALTLLFEVTGQCISPAAAGKRFDNPRYFLVRGYQDALR